jgi:nucleoside-diphosphate-sugar epimerase
MTAQSPPHPHTVLVTGGRGLVGRRILDALAREGRRVVAYDRDPWDGGGVATAAHGELFDVPRLLDVLWEHDVDAIVHTAAISDPDVAHPMPIATFQANVMGTVSVFEAARLTPRVRRVVSFSSSSAYGNADGEVVREDQPLRPITAYGVTKAATDMLGGVYRERYGVEVVTLRLTWVYGPGNRMPGIALDLVRAAVRGEPFREPKGADHPLPLIHVADAAEGAVRAVLAAHTAQPAYNLAGPELPTYGELAAKVAALVPGAEIALGPGYLDYHRLGRFDLAAAERDLGYRPAWTLDRGLPDYVAWLREHDA